LEKLKEQGMLKESIIQDARKYFKKVLRVRKKQEEYQLQVNSLKYPEDYSFEGKIDIKEEKKKFKKLGRLLED
jgi:hypothetical protein